MKKLMDTFLGLLGLALVGYFAYKVFKRALTDHLLKTKAIYTKGVIIDDKNYVPNSPVSHEYSYSYKFTVNGRSFVNNAHDPNLKVGDTVEIEYVRNWPSLNKSLHPAD